VSLADAIDRLTYVPFVWRIAPTNLTFQTRASINAAVRHCSRIGASMSRRRHSVIIETAQGRVPAKFTVPATASQVDVAMKVRASGLQPYRVRFDHEQNVWVVTVIDWKQAA
jgi:hypothetical protein